MPVVIGDAPSQARDIAPTDYAVGWQITGNPDDAVALDTYQVLFEQRLRSILTGIITTDAPTGITLRDLTVPTGTFHIQLDFEVGGSAAELSVNLSTLFVTTGTPANIGATAILGSMDGLAHPDHVHRLPSTLQTETAIVGLEHMATAAAVGRGKRLGFNASTGAPEYQDPSQGFPIATSNPAPVGGTVAAGSVTASQGEGHVHGIAARSVGLAELAAAPAQTDYGKVLGFDPTTGVPTVLDAGQASFIGLTDTAASLGSPGTAVVVNGMGNLLEFGGPFQPLPTPNAPSSLRATDAFDMNLELAWGGVSTAEAYEWQRKVSMDAWPSGDGTRTTQLSIRNSSALTNGLYDFRVRSVGQGGVLRSGWTTLSDIPIIATPIPGTPGAGSLSRLRSQSLRFDWPTITVNNGGSGNGRVTKSAEYDYEVREVGQAFGATRRHNSTSSRVDVSGLTNGTLYEMRVRARVDRSDMSGTEVDGAFSGESNQEKPVKTTVTLTYGVADTRTGSITAPRTLELTPSSGRTFEITNASNPVTDGQFYALDIDRGDEYARNYNIITLETRPLATDITAGSNYMAEADVSTGARRYSIGPAAANSSTQTWFVQVN